MELLQQELGKQKALVQELLELQEGLFSGLEGPGHGPEFETLLARRREILEALQACQDRAAKAPKPREPREIEALGALLKELGSLQATLVFREEKMLSRLLESGSTPALKRAYQAPQKASKNLDFNG